VRALSQAPGRFQVAIGHDNFLPMRFHRPVLSHRTLDNRTLSEMIEHLAKSKVGAQGISETPIPELSIGRCRFTIQS
jgi:hypothetical protein